MARWTATIVVALYLAYRGAGYILLVTAGFPPSFIPLMLLCAGLVVDIAARRRWRPLPTAAALLLVFCGGAALLGRATLMPAFDLATALIIAVPLWAIIVLGQPSRLPSERLS